MRHERFWGAPSPLSSVLSLHLGPKGSPLSLYPPAGQRGTRRVYPRNRAEDISAKSNKSAGRAKDQSPQRLRKTTMTIKEEVHEMRVKILGLRGGMMTLSTALCRFPACGTPMGCNLRCSKDRKVMRQIHEDIYNLVISARMVLTAVFIPQPEVWDTFWCFAEDQSNPELTLALLGRKVISDQDEYIRYYGQIDDEMFDALARGFNECERAALFPEHAWQNGHRLSQILHLTEYLETEMSKKFDLLTSMVSNCEVGKQAKSKKAARA